MVLDAHKCFDTRKESWVFLILSWVCQNIFRCVTLNRQWFRSFSFVFGTWFSTAWSIEFYIMITSLSDCWISVNHALNFSSLYDPVPVQTWTVDLRHLEYLKETNYPVPCFQSSDSTSENWKKDNPYPQHCTSKLKSCKKWLTINNYADDSGPIVVRHLCSFYLDPLWP